MIDDPKFTYERYGRTYTYERDREWTRDLEYEPERLSDLRREQPERPDDRRAA